MTEQITLETEALPIEFEVTENVPSPGMKCKRTHDEDEDMVLFYKVRTKTLIVFLALAHVLDLTSLNGG